MQYICLIYSAEGTGPQPGSDDFSDYIQAYQEFTQECIEGGVMKAGDALQPTSTSTTVTRENGKHESRRMTRQDDRDGLITLEHQNRARWDTVKIAEGTTLLKHTLSKGQVGPYQLQAAISAIHAEAAAWEDTDWSQIAALYELLYTMQPSPLVRVNQAVAISYAHTANAALAVLDSLEDHPAISDYQPYRIARADILLRAGFVAEAAEQLQLAINASDNASEKRFLEHRLVTDYHPTKP